MAVGGPGADTPSPSNATGSDNGGVKVADLPPEGTQGRKAEVTGFQARRPPSVVKRSAPKSDDKGWGNYKPANWVNGTPVY
jgi:hypothetical protein